MVRLGRGASVVLKAAAVVAVGVPIVMLAMRERREHHERLAQLERLTQQLLPLAPRRPGTRRLVLNGAPVAFGLATSTGDARSALDGVRAQCESGDRATMLGLPPGDDGARLLPAPKLRRVEREEAGPEAGAVLCIFGAREDGADTVVRYSLAHRGDDGATSVFTVSTEQPSKLDELFPAGVDAPGGELPGVPRPEGSRREFAATFVGEPYGVRIYEASRPMPEVVARYDAQMTAAGWKPSAAVASAFPDARSYTKGGLQVVASFDPREGSTFVSIAALEPTAAEAPAPVR